MTVNGQILDRLVSESRSSVSERENSASEKLLPSCRNRLVIFGAENKSRKVL